MGANRGSVSRCRADAEPMKDIGSMLLYLHISSPRHDSLWTRNPARHNSNRRFGVCVEYFDEKERKNWISRLTHGPLRHLHMGYRVWGHQSIHRDAFEVMASTLKYKYAFCFLPRLIEVVTPSLLKTPSIKVKQITPLKSLSFLSHNEVPQLVCSHGLRCRC